MRKLIPLYCGLSLIDGLLTMRAVSNGDAIELNPVLGPILDRSPTIFLATKMGITLATCGIAAMLYRRRPTLAKRIIQLGCAVFVLVIYQMWNLT